MRGRPRTAAGGVALALTAADGGVVHDTGFEGLATIFNLPNNDSSVLNGLLHPKDAANLGAILCTIGAGGSSDATGIKEAAGLVEGRGAGGLVAPMAGC